MKSLTALATRFYFTTIKTIFLTTLTTLFYFITIKMKSLRTVAPLFYNVTTIKMKYPTTLTVLSRFTPKGKSLTTLTALLYFAILKWNL